jgi:hypothetical protein
MEHYYGPESTLGAVYYPNPSKIWKKTLSAVKLFPEKVKSE